MPWFSDDGESEGLGVGAGEMFSGESDDLGLRTICDAEIGTLGHELESFFRWRFRASRREKARLQQVQT